MSAFTSAAKVVTDIWAGLTKRVTAAIVQMAAESPALGRAILGVDLHAEDARRKKLDEQARRLGMATSTEDVFTGTNKAAQAEIDRQATTIKSTLDAVNTAMAAKAEESAAAATADHAGGAAETSDEVKRLTEELAALRQQAAVAREAANTTKPAAGVGLPDVASAKASFVTFSAAALAAQSGGSSPQDKVVRELKDQKTIQKNQLKEAEKMRRKLDALNMAMRA